MILLHCYAQRLRNGLPNPKTPPVEWWRDLISRLGPHPVQIGVTGEEPLVKDFRANLPLAEVAALVRESDLWIGVDSFLQHLAAHEDRPGVVVWSVSDPRLFGYAHNLNLLKDRRYLRRQQYALWEAQSYNADAFLDPAAASAAIREWRAQQRRAA